MKPLSSDAKSQINNRLATGLLTAPGLPHMHTGKFPADGINVL